ncbi:MAG: gliding motility-associated C-terminal domain-containing protein [Bacteroidales bacterium]|nr:gliding motility-associated C-terminal domain-containing protein [Bacteroidales bacterium]MDE7071991.1 gliding motility-associated C-terminal domain-containing protein [Bacteroidales bacterium]
MQGKCRSGFMAVLSLVIFTGSLWARQGWFETAFPARWQPSKSASLLKILYDANVVCNGQQVNLSLDHSLYGDGENLSFEWYQINPDQSTVTLDKGETVTFKPLVEGGFRIVALMKEGLSQVGADTLWIYVTHIPEYTMVPDTICRGMEATVGVEGGEYWAWSTSGTSQYINIRPAATTVYHARISNYPIVQTGYINACYAEDSVAVVVNDTAMYEVEGDMEMCMDMEAQLRVIGGTDVEWNGVLGGTTRNFLLKGDTSVQVVATDRYGCRSKRDFTIKAVDIPRGEIVAYVEDWPSDSVCLGTGIRLEAFTDLDCRYRWFNRDTVSFTEVEPKTDFLAYCDISVGAAQNCKTRLEKQISVKNCHYVYFASGFVPGGFSKYYGPIGENDTTRTYQFMVFDANGTMVFSTTRFTDGWDGTYKGKTVPAGVYVYLYRERYDRFTWEKKGTFSVLE